MRLRGRVAAAAMLLGAACGEDNRRIGCGDDLCSPDPDPPQVGDVCDTGVTRCGRTKQLLECQDGAYALIDPPVACKNETCAVCGFVGLDRAGRNRVAERRMRG